MDLLPPHSFTLSDTHPFNGHFSGTTRVSRYQKGKTNLDFTEAKNSEWQWHQLDNMQVCIMYYRIVTPFFFFTTNSMDSLDCLLFLFSFFLFSIF